MYIGSKPLVEAAHADFVKIAKNSRPLKYFRQCVLGNEMQPSLSLSRFLSLAFSLGNAPRTRVIQNAKDNDAIEICIKCLDCSLVSIYPS